MNPHFIRSEGVTVATEVRDLLARHGLVTLDDFLGYGGGERICFKRGRSVVRFELEGRGFFLKRNRLHPVELWKQLSKLRLPPRSARQEWNNILAVDEAGIPTVPPVAFGEQLLCGLDLKSFTLTEELYHTEPLEKTIQRDFVPPLSPERLSEKRRLTMQMAQIARTLHGKGMYHQDFYLGHFFLGQNQALHLIDLQRVVKNSQVPTRYLIKDLAQLAFSAITTGHLTRTDAMRFFKAYLGIHKLGKQDKKLAGKINAKASRIADHTVKLLERRRQRGEVR